jgi:hypothetical protein
VRRPCTERTDIGKALTVAAEAAVLCGTAAYWAWHAANASTDNYLGRRSFANIQDRSVHSVVLSVIESR